MSIPHLSFYEYILECVVFEIPVSYLGEGLGQAVINILLELVRGIRMIEICKLFDLQDI